MDLNIVYIYSLHFSALWLYSVSVQHRQGWSVDTRVILFTVTSVDIHSDVSHNHHRVRVGLELNNMGRMY